MQTAPIREIRESAATCRECGVALSYGTQQCPGCRCRTPFSCSVCSRPLSAVSVGIPANPKNPYGAFSRAGEPLCHEHRLTLCHVCGESYALAEMTRDEVGEHLDRDTRQGKPPRVEPVIGYYCAHCLGHSASEDHGHVQGWLIGGLVVAGGVLLMGLVLLLQ